MTVLAKKKPERDNAHSIVDGSHINDLSQPSVGPLIVDRMSSTSCQHGVVMNYNYTRRIRMNTQPHKRTRSLQIVGVDMNTTVVIDNVVNETPHVRTRIINQLRSAKRSPERTVRIQASLSRWMKKTVMGEHVPVTGIHDREHVI